MHTGIPPHFTRADSRSEPLERVGDGLQGTVVPELDCVTCGHRSSMAWEYVQLGGLQLCSRCSERVANVWWEKHSGEYLTWSRGTRERQVTYRKVPIPEELRWQVFERDEFKCRKCGSRLMLRADHVHPESAGGEATLENLQTLCHTCNCRKGSRIEAAA